MRGSNLIRSRVFSLIVLVAASSMAVWLAACGGDVSVSGGFNPPRGTVSVSISDPPSCRATYQSVYVTVRSVQAHISSSADDNSGGWQELAPNLASNPIQLDLLSTPAGGCTLAMLGTNIALPAGDYQQIRLLLVANNAASGPSPNACSSVNAFNCVVLANGTVRPLLLASQANTGLKIPPGQIVGGPIRVADGQHVDLNIDFNACASIVRQGNNQYRLRPTLTAGQVSSIRSGISGTIVDSATMLPLSGGEVQVALEQPDRGGIDRIIMQAAAAANGTFNFCPVPMGTFDLVAVGQNGAGVTYGATVVTGITGGSNIGNVPLIAQAGATAPGTIQGVVTSENAGVGASIDGAVSALQTITVGGNSRQVTIPLFNMSVSNIATAAMPMAMITCPTNTFCEQYVLILPAQNPSFGAFVSGGTLFSAPTAPPVPLTVEVKAFRPMSGGTATCTPNLKTTSVDPADVALAVTAGMTLTAKQLDFTACN
jgi:hypothetical protein